MNVLAIYRVNEHLADLMLEAAAERQARGGRPTRSRFRNLTSWFTGRGTVTASRNAFANP